MAVTIDSESEEDRINEVFGRINSGGRQLSFQERRQAGLVSPLSEVVRELSSELRGDTSPLRLPLIEMPEVSINTPRDRQGYGIDASDVIWCRHGIIGANELRDSLDEQFVADICISILNGEPLASSREALDDYYDPDSDRFNEISEKLAAYGSERLKNEVKVVFSQFQEIFARSVKMFRSVVHERPANTARAAFYAVFFSIYNLIFKEQKKPHNYESIVAACENLQRKLETDSHFTTMESRQKNIAVVTGLLQRYFVKADPAELGVGAALAVDFENSLRLSRFERNRYELKVGRIDLNKGATPSEQFYQKIVETICGIANVGPDSGGFIYFGVADKESAARRVREIFGHEYDKVAEHYFCGVDFELQELGIDTPRYVREIIQAVQRTNLSEPLRSQVCSQITHGEFRGKTFIRVRIPSQSQLSSVGDKYFIRQESETKEMSVPQALAQAELFK